MVARTMKRMQLSAILSALLIVAVATGCSNREGGTRVRAANYTGDPAGDFVAALHLGDTEMIDRLVDADPSLLELRDEVGQTPMHYAALDNQPQVLKLLKEKGLDPNVRDYEGRTPLTVLEDSGLRYDNAHKVLVNLGGTN